jgi:hypothetical protein
MRHARVKGTHRQFARVFQRQVRRQSCQIPDKYSQGREGKRDPVDGAEKWRQLRRRMGKGAPGCNRF